MGSLGPRSGGVFSCMVFSCSVFSHSYHSILMWGSPLLSCPDPTSFLPHSKSRGLCTTLESWEKAATGGGKGKTEGTSCDLCLPSPLTCSAAAQLPLSMWSFPYQGPPHTFSFLQNLRPSPPFVFLPLTLPSTLSLRESH